MSERAAQATGNLHSAHVSFAEPNHFCEHLPISAARSKGGGFSFVDLKRLTGFAPPQPTKLVRRLAGLPMIDICRG